MNWFRENRFLGTFLIAFAIGTLLVLYFLFRAKSGFEEAAMRFHAAAEERSRLEHADPFPNEANYRKMKVHLENYGAALNKLKDELKTEMFPVAPLAPNEFQSRLRQTMIATADKARANGVKLPNNFHLGFDEFAAALPKTAAAPLLGQELAQVELLMNILIDARVDSVTVFRRAPLPEERGTAPATVGTPGPGRKLATQAAAAPTILERNMVDLTFVGTPSATRKVLNAIASSDQQFFIIRTLHVRNEQEKGPPRQSIGAGAATAPTTAVPAPPSSAIKFIVGNEHIETSAKIEIVRFTF